VLSERIPFVTDRLLDHLLGLYAGNVSGDVHTFERAGSSQGFLPEDTEQTGGMMPFQ